MRGKEFSHPFNFSLFYVSCLKKSTFWGTPWTFFMNILWQVSANQKRPSTPNEHPHHQILNLISVQCTWTSISHKKFHTYGTKWTEHQGWRFLSLGSKRNTGEAGKFSPRHCRGNRNRRQNSRKKIKNVFLEQKGESKWWRSWPYAPFLLTQQKVRLRTDCMHFMNEELFALSGLASKISL